MSSKSQRWTQLQVSYYASLTERYDAVYRQFDSLQTSYPIKEGVYGRTSQDRVRSGGHEASGGTQGTRACVLGTSRPVLLGVTPSLPEHRCPLCAANGTTAMPEMGGRGRCGESARRNARRQCLLSGRDSCRRSRSRSRKFWLGNNKMRRAQLTLFVLLAVRRLHRSDFFSCSLSQLNCLT